MSEPVAAPAATDLDRVVDALRSADRFLLTTHEGPDGDALGSLLAMDQILGQLGKDSVMFLAAKEFPLPVEYRFLPLSEVFHEPPADVVDRTLVFLDCGNIDRMPVEFLQRTGARLVNIDHHHDNTRFGTVNLVDTEASCTAEIVLEIAKRLGIEITPEIATALYVGLVTDTGMFMYENTGAGAHRMAAELIEAGVDVNDIYRRLYEQVPIEKLRLIARALEKIERSTTTGSRSPTSGPRTTPRPAPARCSPRESSTRLRDRGDAVAAVSATRPTVGARPQGQPALDRGAVDVSVMHGARAAAGIDGRPASAATCRTTSWSRSYAPRSPLSSG